MSNRADRAFRSAHKIIVFKIPVRQRDGRVVLQVGDADARLPRGAIRRRGRVPKEVSP